MTAIELFIITLIIPTEQLLYLLLVCVYKNRQAHPAPSLRANRQLGVPNICKLIRRHTSNGKHISFQQTFSFRQLISDWGVSVGLCYFHMPGIGELQSIQGS